jgi:hypothetical protein
MAAGGEREGLAQHLFIGVPRQGRVEWVFASLATRSTATVTASQVLAATPQAAAGRYALLLTTDPDAVHAAQRLRCRV